VRLRRADTGQDAVSKFDPPIPPRFSLVGKRIHQANNGLQGVLMSQACPSELMRRRIKRSAFAKAGSAE